MATSAPAFPNPLAMADPKMPAPPVITAFFPSRHNNYRILERNIVAASP